MSPNAGTLMVDIGLTLRPSLLGLPSGIALSLLGPENGNPAPRKTQAKSPIQKMPRYRLAKKNEKKLERLHARVIRGFYPRCRNSTSDFGINLTREIPGSNSKKRFPTSNIQHPRIK